MARGRIHDTRLELIAIRCANDILGAFEIEPKVSGCNAGIIAAAAGRAMVETLRKLGLIDYCDTCGRKRDGETAWELANPVCFDCRFPPREIGA